jgi:hypothetical protein
LPHAGGPATVEVLIANTLPYELNEPMPVRQGDLDMAQHPPILGVTPRYRHAG